MGWSGGRFSIFDIEPQIPKTKEKLALNYASVVLAAVSAIFCLFIKSSPTPPPREIPYTVLHSLIN
jgi:hypothetical protein